MGLFRHNHKADQSIAQVLPDTTERASKTIRHVVKVGCLVNAFLMLLKISAGYWGHSGALVADGFHSLNDMAADILMLVFVGISYRKIDNKYSYGYGKFETFSSLVISVFLIFISTMIIVEAVEAIIGYFKGEELPQADIWTFVVILFAMLCKEGLFRYYHHAGKQTNSNALVANAWHHRSDALASIATLIGVTFSHFFGESYRILDPIASLVIAFFIIVPAIRLIRLSFTELMEHSLPFEEIEKARNEILQLPDVKAIDYFRTRKVGHRKVFDISIVAEEKLTIKESELITDHIIHILSTLFCPHIMVSVSYISELSGK